MDKPKFVVAGMVKHVAYNSLPTMAERNLANRDFLRAGEALAAANTLWYNYTKKPGKRIARLYILKMAEYYRMQDSALEVRGMDKKQFEGERQAFIHQTIRLCRKHKIDKIKPESKKGKKVIKKVKG